ncbi:small multi-drug export protein [Evansella tamaricis]|uniref:Small multi-drug export protein n=1 Tax=Evansella tamaricis TaxID=2069301 RepID=A0ABS6JJR2_9BACI|nr:small multi-drug export protein [Evansella tamaricis]MBU9713929.1 small multi-drug export protein [Evansella tamaricis]
MNFMEYLWLYLLVFLFAAIPFFEAYGVIPIAIIAGLSPVPTFLLGLFGNVLTVLFVILFVNKIKEWRQARQRKRGEEVVESKRSKRAQRLWKKYGLPGLAMVGPLVVGSHLTAFMSMSFGGTKRSSFYWVTFSITFWSLLFTILVYLGIDLLGRNEEGILREIFEM